MSNKKFFSGNSVRQALLAAAAHFELPPEQIAYREVEKKSGFLKAKKRAVIEVDTENPSQRPTPADKPAGDGAERDAPATKSTTTGRAKTPRTGRPDDDAEGAQAGEPSPDEAEAPATAEEAESSPSRRRRSSSRRQAASPPADAQVPEEIDEPEDDENDDDQQRREQDGDWDDDDGGDDDDQDDGDDDHDQDDQDDDDEGEEDDGDDDDQEPVRAASRRPQEAPGRAAPSPAAASEEESAPGRRRRRRRRGGRGRGSSTTEAAEGTDSRGSSDDLVALPEHPRRPADRYAEAHGPLADATRQALDRVIDVAGLELSYTVLQGEDRLEIELTGRDEALLVAEGGELLRAIEHLVPRVVRSITGEPVSVRVDSADFHEIHEEQLRSLAQRVASEVRRSERPRTLEPMSPADRRIVHITLADEPRVTSMSEGSGYFKRIVVKLS